MISKNESYDLDDNFIMSPKVDFERIPLNRIHTKFHIMEDETGYKLTDILEVHFLELPKLTKIENLEDTNDPILEWLEFIDADSKEGMEMLAAKNENIKTAYEILQRASKSKEARMAYEAMQAEIMDQLTREKTARKEGIEEGIEEGKEEAAINLLKFGVDEEIIIKSTGLSSERIKELKERCK